MKNKAKWLGIIGIVIMFCGNTYLYGQSESDPYVNQLDSKGKKTGLWIEDGMVKRHCYYENGLRNGVFVSFYYGDLYGIGEYKNGEMTGTWYIFNESFLLSTFSNFRKNAIKPESRFTTPKNQCYYISYHKNGKVKSEGLLLWYEDPQLDDSAEYGEWKYYNEDGTLLETKNFK